MAMILSLPTCNFVLRRLENISATSQFFTVFQQIKHLKQEATAPQSQTLRVSILVKSISKEVKEENFLELAIMSNPNPYERS